MKEKICTLKDLARKKHTYWRFSQSEKGKSIERVYAEYKPGKITIAQNEQKKLSFTDERTIAYCFMYGDLLTKLVFDIKNKEFRKIMNCKVKFIDESLGEYESCKLMTEENYSLSDINTIRRFFSMVNNKKQLISIFYGGYGNLESRLNQYGFAETAELVHYLGKEFDRNPDNMFQNRLKLIDQYIFHQKIKE